MFLYVYNKALRLLYLQLSTNVLKTQQSIRTDGMSDYRKIVCEHIVAALSVLPRIQ